MDWTTIDKILQSVANHILLYGGALMAVFYGLKRVYKLAKNVDMILDNSTKNMAAIKTAEESMRTLKTEMAEITREVRPNGGSSMKDQLTNLIKDIGNIKERLGPLEQWKKDIED